MNLPRFYCREALSPGAHIDLPEPVARHAVRVLRLPPGASMTLFDGRGGEYEAHIERIEKNRVVVVLGAWRDVECESKLVVTLIQAVQAGEKKFKYEQKVKLVNPKLYGRGYAIGDMGHTDYVLVADDIVAVEEK